MKKQLLISAILLGSAAAAQAQNNVVKINAVSLVVQTGSVFWEHQIAVDRSLNLGAFVTNYNDKHSGTVSSETQFKGFGLTGEYRFHSGTEALRGFFIGPYLRFQHFNFTETSTFLSNAPKQDKATLTTFGGGGVLGWQGIIAGHFSIEPFLGVGYAAGSVDNLSDNQGTLDIRGGIVGFELRPGLSIGYAFGKAAE